MPDIPVTAVLHNIGGNFLGSLTCNYGANFIGAGLVTWVFIETDIDWNYRNVVYERPALVKSGLPALYIGYILPVVTPVTLYITGRFIKHDSRLQLTGAALTQSLALTLAIQTPIKMITSRALPGIVTELDHARTKRTDNFSGEFHWFSMNPIGGLPSGHTANAFAAAATIAELYRYNLPVKIAAYSYAALIGLGVSFTVHWASEVVAGALIGYAVGTAVGKSYAQILYDNHKTQNALSCYLASNSFGLKLRL